MVDNMAATVAHEIRNGIESMSPGGNLVIRTSVQENNNVLYACDQGAGISPDALDQLGTPFLPPKRWVQAWDSQFVINRHNATIKIDTCERGTTFSVYFNQINGSN